MSQLERSDSVYQEMVDSKVMSDEDSVPDVSTISGKVTHTIKTKDSWASLTEYSKRSGLSANEAISLYQANGTQKLYSEMGNIVTTNTWTSKINSHSLSLKYEIEVRRPNGEEVWVNVEETITSLFDSTLAELVQNNALPLEEFDGYFETDSGSELRKGRLDSYIRRSANSDFFNAVIAYLQSEKTREWADGEILYFDSESSEGEFSVVLGLRNDVTISFPVENPKDSSNRLWQLAELVLENPTDPLLLENERISVKPINEASSKEISSYVIAGNWIVREKVEPIFGGGFFQWLSNALR